RELLKQDSNYVRLTDAVMEIYQDNFYGNDINNRSVKLIESRISDDMLQNNMSYEMSPSRLINRLRPLNFPSNFFEDYDFQMNITSVDTSIVYAISTKPKDDLQKTALEGTIYIRKCDSAFIGYDAKVSKRHLKYFPERKIHIKYKGRKKKVKVSVVKELSSSRYFEYQGHWYLRNTSLNRTHKLSSSDGSIQILIDMDAQLVVYDLQVGDTTKPIKRGNINYNKIIPPTKPYNQEFWNSFNVLDYTVVEKEIKKSLEKNRTLNEQFIENDKH
ncbi:MAG: hypothetical protein GY870_20640, partial [archaeon]|nr:hypothetical protein [archaeon]